MIGVATSGPYLTMDGIIDLTVTSIIETEDARILKLMITRLQYQLRREWLVRRGRITQRRRTR